LYITTTALHLYSYYAQRNGLKRGDFPHAEYISDRIVLLPLSAKLSERDIDDVVNAVKNIKKA
jgi:dTDP-4-amino-4,6-dideoxygalactose transaminase